MDAMIFWTLIVDGVVNGTIYALLAIGLVLVFVVTRVILLPQGVYVSFAALTLSQFQRGNRPGTAALLVALGIAVFVVDVLRTRRRITRRWLIRRIATDLLCPAAMYALV